MLKILSDIDDLKNILDSSKKLIQIGVTKIFMKEEVKNALEYKLNRIKFILRLQNSFRMYKMKKKLLMTKYSIKTVSKFYRGHVYRKLYKKIKNLFILYYSISIYC